MRSYAPFLGVRSKTTGLEGATDFSIKTAALRLGIERTIFAAARENTRYAINGVLWEKNDGKLTLVATDGRRLALSQTVLEKSSGNEVKAIVPTKAMQVFIRLHPDADEIIGLKHLQSLRFGQRHPIPPRTAILAGPAPIRAHIVETRRAASLSKLG